MDRITVLDEDLWPGVPDEVIAKAKETAALEPCWIAKREDGHFVSIDGPGSPDVATGDLILVAEVSPAKA